MMNHPPPAESLVLYKSKPARLLNSSDRIEIETANGKHRRVREKDIELLHPGPVGSLAALNEPLDGEIEEAWALMGDEALSLADLSELIFGDYTPHSSWCCWQLLQEELYFHGTVEAIRGHKASHIEAVRHERETREQAEAAWAALLQRIEAGRLLPEDHTELSDVERLALGRSEVSRIHRDLKLDQRPEVAHRLLCRCGYWPPHHNPYPARLGVELKSSTGPLPRLPEEPRRDLTHLQAWAIDDHGNQDPDDAISLDGEQIWVHVADVAALITPDSELDLQARAHGANLYLPERVITMLPREATEQLGLGLQQRSPALSFRFTLDHDARPEAIEITPSWVQVTRISYDEVEQQIDHAPFAALYQLALRYQQRRRNQGAIRIQLPEVKVQAHEAEVTLTPLPALRSRDLVTEFMLMAGEAAARFAEGHQIPFPYSTQPPPDPDPQGNPWPHPETVAEMFAFRRRFQRSQSTTIPSLHAGLGMSYYSQVTSPLRRYLDLVAHQQLRHWITGTPLLDNEAIIERVGAAEAVIGSVRRAERLSNLHWKLIWLQQRPDWRGEGIVVEINGERITLLIPELALDCKIKQKGSISLGERLPITLGSVDLSEQLFRFRG